MKFIRYLRFDIQQGILRNKALLFTPAVIAIIIFLDFVGKAHGFLDAGLIAEGVSYGDYCFYLYGGMYEYIPDVANAFRFPVVWITVFLVIPFLLLNYPFKDLFGAGQQILVRSGRRTAWWMSKCCWNILGTILYHLIMQLTALALFGVLRMEISNRIHMDFIRLAFQIGHQEVWEQSILPFAVAFLPILVSVSINMFQMTLSLFVKPIFGFFTVSLLFLASAYRLSSWLIGNYAMIYRYDWMLKTGVSMKVGAGMVASLLFVSVIAGLIRFRYYDILEKE